MKTMNLPLSATLTCAVLAFAGRASGDLVEATALEVVGDVKLITNEGHVVEMAPQC